MNEELNIRTGVFLKGFEKVISKDDLRPIFGGVAIIENKFVATDAHHLVEVDLDMLNMTDFEKECLKGKFIDKDLLAELIRIGKNQEWYIDKDGFNFLKAKRVFKKLPIQNIEDIGKFPNYKNVIPDKSKYAESTCSEINFKPELFVNIVNIIDKNDLAYKNDKGNTEKLVRKDLKFNLLGADKAILVNSNATSNFIGIVMPLFYS